VPEEEGTELLRITLRIEQIHQIGLSSKERRRAMKNRILAIIVTAGVFGCVASSHAQDAKKLQPSPRAAADQSMQSGRAALPESNAAAAAGESSPATAKPTTGKAAASGGNSNADPKRRP
jgi:type IV secretory pathway TrbL component